MVVGLFVYQHLFSSRETKFLINLLRTHPRFRSATWPLLLPQVLRYPLGRDYSVTPPLSVERGNSWVAAAPPAVKRARINVQKFAGVFNSVNSNWMFLRKPAEWTFRASYVWLSKFRRLAWPEFFECVIWILSNQYQLFGRKLKNKFSKNLKSVWVISSQPSLTSGSLNR